MRLRHFFLAVPAALIFLTCCTVTDAIRAQKRTPIQPEVDFAATGPAATATSAADPPCEKKFKNIQVLQGLPSSQLYPVMAFISNSLGVTCAHCHTTYFEEESIPEKAQARQMIRMTRSINRTQFQGQPLVTCNSCHNGKDFPSPVPQVSQSGWQRMLSPKPAAPSLPDLQSVLDRYSTAMGGNADGALPSASGDISVVGGLDERSSGRFELGPGNAGAPSFHAYVHYPETFEKALARYRLGRLNPKQMFGSLQVLRHEQVDGHDAIVVVGQSGDAIGERLAFDSATGLLLRVQCGTPTDLGYVPEEIVFSDYQPVGGVPTPRTVRWGRGDYQVTLKFTE